MTVDDRGNGGKSRQGNADGSLSASILLAMQVEPINDPPMILVPTAVSSSFSLTADEDQIGIVGISCCGWSEDNMIGATTISNSSIVLSDADYSYDSNGATLQQSSSRWALAQEDDSPTSPLNDTVTVIISTGHGSVQLNKPRSEVTVEDVSSGNTQGESTSLLQVSGSTWAVADALKGLRYRTALNWNSWVGSGGEDLHPVVVEVRKYAFHQINIILCAFSVHHTV